MLHHPAIRLVAAAILLAAGNARGAAFGTAVAIGGQAFDIALDEGRSALYVSNFTASRVEVIDLASATPRTAMRVAAQPAGLALSPDGRYLLVAHYGNLQVPATSTNALTIIDLATSERRTLALSSPPLGVAFGGDGKAFVATSAEFLLLDPATAGATVLDTLANSLTTSVLPARQATAPGAIVAAALAASADGRYVFGLLDTLTLTYDVAARRVTLTGTAPAAAPRAASAARDGSYYAAGIALFDRQGTVLAQFAPAANAGNVGSMAVDAASGVVYAQMPSAVPTLVVADAPGLRVRERLTLPENLTGRALLNAAADTLYAVSESGVMVMPVGSLGAVHRLAAGREILAFRGGSCRRGAISQQVRIVDPGGGTTSFFLSSDLPGVRISPPSGQTPATVTVTVDPTQFADRSGTVSGWLRITSSQAVNQPEPVRLVVHHGRPEERGTTFELAGRLVDLVADPARDRFYILRQDRNEVLVAGGASLAPVTTLSTSNTPSGMAITADRKYLLIGHDNAQLVYVYDLDTFDQMTPVRFPDGHYPRSVAASSNAILAVSRVAGYNNTAMIDRLDLVTRTAATLPSLGAYENLLSMDTVLAATPNGGAILAASSDGNVLLYDASADTFTVSRKLGAALSGAYSASSHGRFTVGNALLNASLVPVATWAASESTAGFTYADGVGVRLLAAGTTDAAGITHRVDLATGETQRPTRIAEQPPAASGSVFTRTLAALSNRTALVALTVSGYTALAWDFDTPVAPPRIEHVVNAADGTSALAPGSLIVVLGSGLSPTNAATREMPLPTALGESCLSLNGTLLPMLMASPRQINAQLPYHIDGTAVLTLFTPGGASDDYYLVLSQTAPAIFRNGTAGSLTGIASVVRRGNGELVTPSNPIHPGDAITIYATGLGLTAPEVEAGSAPAATARTVIPVEVQLGSAALPVEFAGLAPSQVGVYQILCKVPGAVSPGLDVPLTLIQGGARTAVPVRVVE